MVFESCSYVLFQLFVILKRSFNGLLNVKFLYLLFPLDVCLQSSNFMEESVGTYLPSMSENLCTVYL